MRAHTVEARIKDLGRERFQYRTRMAVQPEEVTSTVLQLLSKISEIDTTKTTDIVLIGFNIITEFQ
jgi:hypothetical protein